MTNAHNVMYASATSYHQHQQPHHQFNPSAVMDVVTNYQQQPIMAPQILSHHHPHHQHHEQHHNEMMNVDEFNRTKDEVQSPVGEDENTTTNNNNSADSDENNFMFVSMNLNADVVQKLKSLNAEQFNYLKQLGIMTIQFENDKYAIDLSSPKKRGGDKKRKQPIVQQQPQQQQITNVPGVQMKKDDSIPSAYVPTSGLTLDESTTNQQNYLINSNSNNSNQQTSGSKQQFTMPCPMLKHLLKNETQLSQTEVPFG